MYVVNNAQEIRRRQHNANSQIAKSTMSAAAYTYCNDLFICLGEVVVEELVVETIVGIFDSKTILPEVGK